jgi:hypothetical protein
MSGKVQPSMMIHHKTCPTIGALLVAVSIFLIMGCSGIVTTPIDKIIQNPRAYEGKTVTVSGEVTEVFSLLVIKYFVIRDATGEMVVITKKPLPQKGTRLKVKGTVEEAFSLGQNQLIVIVENHEKGP